SPASGPVPPASKPCGPALDLVEDGARGILLEEVPGSLEQVGAVDAREQLLPPLQLRLAERPILQRPADQRRLVAQPREVVLDVRHGGVRLVERILRLGDEL